MTKLLEDSDPWLQGLSGLLTLTPICGGEPRNGERTGIKALMLAVLEDGIRSCLSRMPQIRAEAECWVMSPHRKSPFSFAVVCETLGLDPEAARRAILNLQSKNNGGQRFLRRSRPNVRSAGRLVTQKPN